MLPTAWRHGRSMSHVHAICQLGTTCDVSMDHRMVMAEAEYHDSYWRLSSFISSTSPLKLHFLT